MTNQTEITPRNHDRAVRFFWGFLIQLVGLAGPRSKPVHLPHPHQISVRMPGWITPHSHRRWLLRVRPRSPPQWSRRSSPHTRRERRLTALRRIRASTTRRFPRSSTPLKIIGSGPASRCDGHAAGAACWTLILAGEGAPEP